MLSSIVAAPVYIPTNTAWGVPFLYINDNILYQSPFGNSHHSRYEVIAPHGVTLLFKLNDQWCWAHSHVPVGHLDIDLHKNIKLYTFAHF